MRLMSILKTVCTWALVRLESTIRWAMIERMRVSGTSSSPTVATGDGGAAGLAAAGAGAGAAGLGAGAAGAPLARWLRMSSFVILPADPVPGTWRRSRLFSLAILRTSGEERTRSPDSAASVSASGSATVWAIETGAGGVLGAALAPPAAPLITATTVLIWTVVPACTLISESTPAAGEGISASTLSVEISNNGSSCCTVSPGFFSHLVMVPSKIDSPIWGMMTSLAEAGAAVAVGAGELAALGGSMVLAGVLAGVSTAGTWAGAAAA